MFPLATLGSNPDIPQSIVNGRQKQISGQDTLTRPKKLKDKTSFSYIKRLISTLIKKKQHFLKVIYDYRPPYIPMPKYLRISSYISKPFLMCDFATAPI